MRYESSENCFFFVLLSGDWYRHWIILDPPHFLHSRGSCQSQLMALSHFRFYSTFVSLDRVISKHRIILDSHCFSAFVSLVQLKIFSTSQSWAVWRNASFQSCVTLSSSPGGLLRSSFVSTRGWNLPWFMYFSGRPRKSLWWRLTLTRCTWTLLLSSMPNTQLTRHFRWGNTYIMFTLENWSISSYATNMVCQKGSSS